MTPLALSCCNVPRRALMDKQGHNVTVTWTILYGARASEPSL